ncbi:MAG: Adenylate cyclase CyaB, class 2 (thermophilic) [Candidatus Methanohalarchaeum thermophilum]|uniref:Adenylate cyclase CyaB, class 2 (Thermophilic) n=1 Tax=Methanohalarchaeum thermophilum TaxID=1903181 RepID=A0A1Q6DXP8_METT1|nr:MAG: Adenylate cyclase CyaB, class 2 (thermophilic) [Candidatus Methanohalarchaeum thermophilum]
MIEVEVKAKLSNKTERKVKNKFNFKKEIKQTDYYFNHPNRDFKKTDEALRIRKTNTDTYLTYKGSKLDEKSKSREEYEIKVSDFEETKKILTKLSFRKPKEVKKTRQVYEKDSTKIYIDNVKGLGKFIEVEKIANETEYKNKLHKCIKLIKDLGIDENNLEKRSYLELLEN